MSQFTASEQERLDQGLPPWESMSFACGGWLQFYMYGVCKALQVSGLDQGVTYCGCSAGALAAAGIALGGDFDMGVKYCKEECIPVALASFEGLTNLHVYVGGCTDKCFTPVFTIEKASKCQLATTKLPFLTGERVTSYTSAADFKSALLASCAAFPAAKMEMRSGVYCVDGGLSAFQPVVDEDTITVSPFYFSDADIKPSRYVPIWWAFLPPNSSEICDWLYSLGFEDGVSYIKKRGILQHIREESKVAIIAMFNKENETLVNLSRGEIAPINNDESSQRDSSKDKSTASNYSIARNTRSKSSSDLLTTTHHKTPTKSRRRNNNLLSSPTHALRSLIRDIRQVCRLGRDVLHPYDTPRRVSMHRFLGYDTRTLTDNKISFVMDLFLLFLLVFVWKPLALVLIYFELLFRVVYLTVLTVLSFFGIRGQLLYMLRILRKRPPSKNSSSGRKTSGQKLYDCIHCILSLSLLLRFISGRPSSVELRKHDRLAKQSLIYRVFRHII